MQFSFLGANSLTVILNGRAAIVNGVETDLNYTDGGLSLSAAAAYTNAKTSGNICHAAIVVDPSPNCSGLDSKGKPDFIVVPSGSRLAITPKLKLSGTARYTWSMGAGKSHVQAAVSHQGSALSELRPDAEAITGKIKASTLLDLFIGYDWSHYSAELFATNVFDTRNQISRFVSCSICDQVHIVPGRPRTIGVRLGYHF